jgi:hypothetical protein
MHQLQLAAPYLVAVGVYLLAPLLSKLVGFKISAAIDRARLAVREDGGEMEGKVPYYLSGEMISIYVDYAADAAQVIPVILLPIVGAVYGFTSVPTPVAVSFLVGTFLIAIAMLAWMLILPPANYRSRKRRGFSILMIFGIMLNLIGMSLALSLS